MPAGDRERALVSSTTFATAEVLTPSPTEEKTIVEGGRVTKVTTTHYSTKTVTTRLAIGNEREITAVMASSAMNPPLNLFQNIDDDAGAIGGISSAATRKVSFPQDPLSARSSEATATVKTPIFSGRLLKYGYRLFGKNWHPVNMVISRDGVVEWSNADDEDHSHIVKLKELPAGMVAVGRSCLEIPAYLSPKINKGTNADHIIAMGKHKNGKVKSYWFLAESPDEFSRVKAALGHICGQAAVNLDGKEVRKVWLGQGEVALPDSDGALLTHKNTTTLVRDCNDADDNVQTPRRRQKSAKEQFFEST